MSFEAPEELEKKAEKKLKSWFGKQAAREDAAELYQQAANKYKISRKHVEAGKAYEKAANCLEQAQGTPFDIATQYIEAAKVYKLVSFDDHIRCLEKAIALEIQAANIRQAALHLKQAAESCEGQGQFDKAIEHYEHAVEFYKIEDTKSSVQACQTQLAVIYSLHKQDYAKAASIYETLAKSYLETSLTRFNAKECWFKAALCLLMTEKPDDVRSKWDNYSSQDPNLANTFEETLINGLCESVEEGDIEKFTAAIQRYDEVHRLDPWKTQILTKLKEKLTEETDEAL